MSRIGNGSDPWGANFPPKRSLGRLRSRRARLTIMLRIGCPSPIPFNADMTVPRSFLFLSEQCRHGPAILYGAEVFAALGLVGALMIVGVECAGEPGFRQHLDVHAGEHRAAVPIDEITRAAFFRKQANSIEGLTPRGHRP